MHTALNGLISQGEGIELEFKTCRDRLPRSVYETVCAFLNRQGGTLILGVDDSGCITGIDPQSLESIRRDFATAINNPGKLNPPTWLSINEVELEGKHLLQIYIPESSQVHRCNGRIYDRNEDGDFDITDNTDLVAQLYLRKRATYTENRVYPWVQPDDLRSDLIDRCRRYLKINRKDHPWTEMTDSALLQSAQLLQRDPDSGRTGTTLAGIMLFGTDETILQVCPAHRTDLILRKVDVDRYDDRDLVRTNLIESYDRILAFVKKHLPDPFYLDGIERRSLRDIIFREVASNMLIHREYTSGATSRLIIEYGRVVTDNPSRPHGFGPLNPETAVPFQKNPNLSAFFRAIDRADELGSGMRKLMLWGKKYGGDNPQLIEGDNFRMVIAVPEFGDNPARSAIVRQVENVTLPSTPEVAPEVAPEVTPEVTPEVIAMLRRLSGPMNRQEIMSELGLKDEKHFREHYLQCAISKGLIEMTIPDKPRSRHQKYRITTTGRDILKNNGHRALEHGKF